MPPTDKTVYNVDWLLSNTSNIHIATSRDWFNSYTSLTTVVSSPAAPSLSHPAIGIGSVSIPLKPYLNKPGSNTITLSNVLHVPDASANVVCMSLLKEDFQIEGHDSEEGDWKIHEAEGKSLEWKGGWIRNNQAAGGRKLGIVEVVLLPKLRLKGQPPGHTSVKDQSLASAGLQWPPEEVEKWEQESGNKVKTGVAEPPPTSRKSSTEKKKSSMTFKKYGRQALFTPYERRWVVGAYGGEEEFLQKYGIIDRSEARRLVREIMEQDDVDEDITEARIQARAILKKYQSNKDPAEAARLEQAAGLADMMLQAAPGNLPFVDQRDDSDSD